MSVKFKQKGDKHRYSFLEGGCIGRDCWAPGLFNHYNRSISGANSVTNQTPCCISREHRGCDTEQNKPQELLKNKRKNEGWKQL